MSISPEQVLSQKIKDAIITLYGPEYADIDPKVHPSKFADFQSDVAFELSRRLP